MSELNSLAEASATFNASKFLSRAFPGYSETFYLTKEGVDPNHDVGPVEVGISDAELIDAFVAQASSPSLVASPIVQPDRPACFALWFERGAKTPAEKLPPSVHLQAEDGRQVLVYHIDGSASDLLFLRDSLEPKEKDTHRLSADVPFGSVWTVAEGSTFGLYSAAEVDFVIFGSDNDKQSGADYGFDPESFVFGRLFDCVLEHPLAASVIPNYKSKLAKNVSSTVWQLFLHLSKHEENESKEGLAIIGADLDDDAQTGKPRRKIENTRTVSFIGFDFDSGQTPESVIAALRSRGIAFAIYSSHSHMKDGKTPKFRVVIPLSKPFNTADHASRKEANKVWKASYEAFGDALALEYDPAAKDMSRLFNSPRHAKGRPFFSHFYAGMLFDLPIVQPE